MVLKNKVSDSAYMVNISRNKSIHLSKDVFSHLWIPVDQKHVVQKLWDKYSSNVYQYDDIELGIRTLFFLNSLISVIQKNPKCIFVNIGSGFTSYQYLVNESIFTIEIDYPEIISAKKKRALKLKRESILPHRTTRYFSCDLNNRKKRASLFRDINSLVNGRDTFVLCEGLFYYLPLETVNILMKNISKLQNKGNLMCFDYWLPELKKSNIYDGMINFYNTEMNISEKDINLFDPVSIIDKKCSSIIENTNVFEQEKKYSSRPVLDRENGSCLEENYMQIENIQSCTTNWL